LGEVVVRILFAAIVSAWLVASTAAAQVTALTHATLIDGTGAAPQRDMTIVMENGRIRDIGPAATTAAPPTSR